MSTPPAPTRSTLLPARGVRVAAGLGGVALAFVLATLLDGVLFHALLTANRELLESRDWYRLLRIMGYFPTWLAVGAVLMLIDSAAPFPGSRLRPSPIWSRGPFVMASAGLAGLLAEGLKILIRRARPIDTDGAYAWVPWSTHTFDSSELGIPSSHAAVAFGAAFAVAHLYPRAGLLLLPLAAGCGLTRILTGQHFASDVVAGGLVGWLLPTIITSLHERRAG